MKNFLNTLVSAVLAVIVIILGISHFSKVNTIEALYAENETITATMDSISAIKAIKPDTTSHTETRKDPPVIEKIIYRDRPRDGPGTTSVETVLDSIVNDSIDVRIKITASQVFDIEWEYRPIVKETTKIINTPYPVLVDKPVPVPAKGWYGSAGIGYAGIFVGQLGILRVNGDRMFGADLLFVGNNVGAGARFALKF